MEWVRFDRRNKWREREREKQKEGLWWDGRYGVKLQNQNGKPIILVEFWTLPLFKMKPNNHN